MRSHTLGIVAGLALVGLASVALAAGGAAPARPHARRALRTATVRAAADSAHAGAADTSMTLHGGQEGTVFRTLTVEGEDRIQFDFERPALDVDVDPQKAPGLDWGSARDVLDRTTPDVETPLLRASAREASPYPGRPWLRAFATGAVARFRPQVTDVAAWKLTVADAHGNAVRTFAGRGAPPEEIAWDGRAQDGSPVVPGLTYSYVLEATDRAGNHRHFVGEGFRVSAYRVEAADGLALLFEARDLGSDPLRASPRADAPAPAIVLEAASWLNQAPWAARPLAVTVTARSRDEADALAAAVAKALAPELLGGAGRVHTQSLVATDVPEGGVIRIATTR